MINIQYPPLNPLPLPDKIGDKEGTLRKKFETNYNNLRYFLQLQNAYIEQISKYVYLEMHMGN